MTSDGESMVAIKEAIMLLDPDCIYHADRARDEAVRAIETDCISASAVHHELCLLHCGRLIAALLVSSVRTGR